MEEIQHVPEELQKHNQMWEQKIALPTSLDPWKFIHTGKKNQLNLLDEKSKEYLYSPTNIDIEVRQWVGLFDPHQTEWVIVYGVGLGYYYFGLKQWLQENEKRRLIFIEDDLHLIRAFFETSAAKDLLQNRQVELHYFSDLNAPEFDLLIKRLMFRKIFVTSLASYQKKPQSLFQNLEFFINFFRDLYETSTTEYLLKGKAFFKNFYSNVLQLEHCVDGTVFLNLFKNVPAIICGAGPSLAKNIELLKTLRNRALIFAGGTAMNALNAYDLVPHFGAGVDPFFYHFTRIIANKAYETPFFFKSRMNKDALATVHGPKIYLPGSTGYPIATWIDEKLGYSKVEIENGSNVINMSFAIAHALGCNPIICVGLDLAYTDGRSYAKGITAHGIHDPKEQFITKGPSEELILAKDIYGKPIHTLLKWIFEATWYSSFAKQHPELLVLNCTEGGIGFDGIANLSLKEAADKYLQKDFQLEAQIALGMGLGMEENRPSLERIRIVFEEYIKSLQTCKELLEGLRREIPAEWPHKIPKAEAIDKLWPKMEKEIAYQHLLKIFDESYQQFTTVYQADQSSKVSEALKGRLPYLLEIIDDNLKQIRKALKHKVQEIELLKSLPKENLFDETLLKQPPAFRVDYPSGKPLFLSWEPDGDTYFLSQEGQILYQKRYRNGKENGKQSFYFLNGVLKTVLSFKEGKLDGEVKLFYPNGALMRSLNYVNGKKEGMETFFSLTGKPLLEAEYEQDLPVNVAKIYYQEDLLAKEIHYSSPGVISKVMRFDPDENVLLEQRGATDYFDQLAQESLKVGKSLEEANQSIAKILKSYEGNLSEEQNRELSQDFNELANEIAHLNMLSKELEKMNVSTEEIIWKTPASEEALKRIVNQAAGPMQESLFKLESKLKYLRDLLGEGDEGKR